MRFRLKTILLVTAAISLAMGTWVSGSIFLFVITLLLFVLGLSWVTVRLITKRGRFPAFSLIFTLFCWVGLVQSLRAPFPISGVPLWQSMSWSVTDYGKSWIDFNNLFHFNSSVYLAMVYLSWTMAIAAFSGLVVQLIYVRIRRQTDSPSNLSRR